MFALAASDSLELRRSFITNETELDARRAHRDSEGRARGGRRRQAGGRAAGTGPRTPYVSARKDFKLIVLIEGRRNGSIGWRGRHPRRLPLLSADERGPACRSSGCQRGADEMSLARASCARFWTSSSVLASRSRAAVARAPLLRVAVGNELLRWPPAARWLGSSAPVTLDTPFISDTIPLAEGILGNIDSLLKEVGDSVEEDEVVAVVETDKVSLDVRAGRAGVVTEVLVSVGEEVKETQPLYVLEPSD